LEGDIMKIVVIGGTGLIGSKLVKKLQEKGHDAIAAAPNTGVNTITGEGLKEALSGAEVVVDLANGRTRRCSNSSRPRAATWWPRKRPPA
jgi:uncharacterized protein YbjT (DUF2867 family)